MTPQLEAAWRLHEAVTSLGYRYALIGGLAVRQRSWNGRSRWTWATAAN